MRVNGAEYATKLHQDDASLPYLFMLHGFMGNGCVFRHIIDELRSACNPVTVDLLGHGASEKVVDPDRYREEQQIADIIYIIEQVGAGARYCTDLDLGDGESAKASANFNASIGARITRPLLYGYSMGGRLALKTALQAPERFAGLMLESTNYGITGEAKRAERRKADAEKAHQIIEDYPTFLEKWENLPLFKSPGKRDKELENRYRDIHLAQDPEAMAASLKGFGTGSMKPVRNALNNYKHPALVIAGTGDQKYMEISQSLVACFNRAHFCPIPAGHRVHLDNPSQLSRELIQFIQECI